MKREKIKVEKRTTFGKQLKKLRRDGAIPANIYGKDFASTAVQLPLKEFAVVYNKVHETGLIDVEFEGKAIPVLIQNVHFHSASREPLHADFYKVNLKEKVTTSIPVVGVGKALAEVDKKGVLLQTLTEVEIEALPTDLPEKLEVSITDLKEVGGQITVENLTAPTGVTILTEASRVVFKIDELVSKEAEEQAAADEATAAEAKTEAGGGEGKGTAAEQGAEEQKEQPAEPSNEKLKE